MPIENLHNEALLIRDMQAGSEDAFTTLYRHYSPRLYINILRMVKDPVTAEEMIQELFTRVWHKKEYKGLAENFAGYLYTIGQHLVQDFYRKQKRDRRVLEKMRVLQEPVGDDAGEQLEYQQTSALIHRAIEQLAPQQKKVYQLVKIEGCTYKKAAQILGISPLTIKEYLVASNKSIRHYILTHADSGYILAALLVLEASRS